MRSVAFPTLRSTKSRAAARRTASLLANTMFCALFGLTGVFAVAKIAFAG